MLKQLIYIATHPFIADRNHTDEYCTHEVMLEVTVEIWFVSLQDRLLEDATQNSMHELVEHVQLYKQMVRGDVQR